MKVTYGLGTGATLRYHTIQNKVLMGRLNPASEMSAYVEGICWTP